ncbi:RHS repeat-associated core domain-containing protein [Pseudomonas sp. S11P7]|uniref:RHS repeat-associated core domain-containing protein n=2 Tax=unclassified Pseudomonas TaxID=196821 RepID=UPI00215CF7BE|nr:RHS repeat-associated core domain-containing protein [Pseudomonas sp. S11P7]MCR8935089.1 RHS repeat-associated core domain-containing protein [Pseudomonas sp. S11A4]MCR8973349.1 RHS repeat-associated core domain-containing protein [Pseudomonas sp. S11P7]
MKAGAVHWRTPMLAVTDPRELPVRRIEYLRETANGAVIALVTRQQHDPAGRLIAQRDPRLPAANLTTIHALNGERLKTDSVDAGWRLNLPGLAGEPLQRWDARGNHWRTTFDEQLRKVAVDENNEAGVDLFTYAGATADAGYNQRGKLLEQKDRSGSLRTDSFALADHTLSETRTFDDGAALTSRFVFSPLGAVLEQTDAGGHRQRSRYGLAGQPRQLHLLISGHSDWQAVLQDISYNAANQIIEQLAGNDVRSRWSYDPADGRLHTQSSRINNGEVLQDFEYFYDRVGNITRIEDHVFEPHYFANQRVDGHREFSYDSLYRLTHATGYDDAPPSDIPGLPQPTDPNNRLNYTQTYQYDHGGNLIELRHVRAGNSYTRLMRVDPQSNRGVRWKPGDGEPDFDTLFDRHGNQQAVHPGQPLTWNNRDEVQQVTLVGREQQKCDIERYAYSQGVRVCKRHEYLAANAEHFHQVRYLPGLEIRSKDNGEELHIISVGSARCLHWVANKPEGIDADQLRYSLEDHLGSCVIELDQQARLISQEGYYPFGETAWMAARSALEVSYRFVRYSGKEMDVSGLYYYGARYYAPWLQRWASADPAGDVDGLNLYAMVSNNPMVHVDIDGRKQYGFADFLNLFRTTANVASQVHDAATVFDGPADEEANMTAQAKENVSFRSYLFSKNGIAAFSAGFTIGGALGGAAGSPLPGVGNAIGGVVGGLLGGLGAAYIRYRFFKRGIRLTEALHTAEIRDATQTVADSAEDLANGTVPGIIMGKVDQMRLKAEEKVLAMVEEMSPFAQLDFADLMEKGASVVDAYRQISAQTAALVETVQNTVEATQHAIDNLSEAEGVTGRLQQLERSITEEPSRKPVPKPRLDLQRRRQAEQSSA